MSRVLLVVQEASRPQRHIEAAVSGLVRRGHDVLLCACAGRGPLLDLAGGAGAATVGLGGAAPSNVLVNVNRLRRVVAEWEPDVVHAHEPLPALIAGLAARRRPVLYHRHHVTGSPRLHLASWAATRVTTATIAVSDAVAARVPFDDRRAPSSTEVARNGIEPLRPVSVDEVAALRRSLGITDGVVVTTVARLRREKGVDVLLAALAEVRAVRPLHLVVVGTGPEESRLRRAAPAGGGCSVHFVGHHDDVAPWYALGDIAVLPSRTDAMPLGAVEAMAAARPLVAAAVGGLPEIVVAGETGLLVPPDDPPALGAAIAELAADEPTRLRMGAAAAARYASRFSADAMVSAWERAYERLAGTT